MTVAKHTARKNKSRLAARQLKCCNGQTTNIPIQAGQALSMQSNATAHFSSLKQAKLASSDAEMLFLSSPFKPQPCTANCTYLCCLLAGLACV